MHAVILQCKETELNWMLMKHKALCCIPLTSSERFGNCDNTLSDPALQVYLPPPTPPCRPLHHPPSTRTPHTHTPPHRRYPLPSYISVVLLICSIWPWMIRQVEAPRWNETHPSPLSVFCFCNDLREDGEEKEPIEMDPLNQSALQRPYVLASLSPPGTVCSG